MREGKIIPLVPGDRSAPWLSMCRSGWQFKPIKYLCKINANVLAESTFPDTEFKYIDISSVDSHGNWTASEPILFAEAPSRARRILFNGDILISTVRTYLKAITHVNKVIGNLICSTGFAVLSAGPDVYPGFLAYWVRSNFFIDEIVSRSVGVSYPAINASEIGSFPFPIMGIDEQQAIASFLDRETGRIDALIEKKERQVELLQEERAALISHAVTKGLNPNVKMKDSRIEWLGDIPEQWEVIRVKALAGNSTEVVQTGPFGAQLHANDYVDDGIPLILIRNVVNMQIDETDIPKVTLEDAKRLSMYRLETGDIVFSRVGSIGRIALCTEREKGWLISGQMLRLRIHNPKLDSKFSLYAFSSTAVLTFVDLKSVGSTRESINTDILRNMPLPIPPTPEQHIIAAFLDREIAKIETLIDNVKISIEKLQEYRTALISAAVTGKIDVRQEITCYDNL